MPQITPDHKLIFVNIKHSYEAMKAGDKASPYYRENLKECTRKFWNLADEKVNTATHILGCYKGIVMEVIRISSVRTSINKYPGRKIFEGEELNDSEYLGMNIREIFGNLANFRVKYYNF